MTPQEFSESITRILGKIFEKYGDDHSCIFTADEDQRAALCMTESGDLYVYNTKMPYNASHVTHISYLYDPDFEKPSYIYIAFFNDDGVFIHLNDGLLTFEFHDDYHLEGPINRVLYEYRCLVESGELSFSTGDALRINKFLAAVEYIKAHGENTSPDVKTAFFESIGLFTMACFRGPNAHYPDDIGVFMHDGLTIYLSHKDGLFCEGRSLSTGTHFNEPTHFDNVANLLGRLQRGI